MLHEGLGCVGMWGDFPDKVAAATGWAALPVVTGSWSHLTGLRYDADAEQYRDYYSKLC